MTSKCAGLNCEVALTCGRFNRKSHTAHLCTFAGNEAGPAVQWVPLVRVVTLQRAGGMCEVA